MVLGLFHSLGFFGLEFEFETSFGPFDFRLGKWILWVLFHHEKGCIADKWSLESLDPWLLGIEPR